VEDGIIEKFLKKMKKIRRKPDFADDPRL